ncbi:hypothetical protein GCM10025865_25400 [Paraoerskovia sediminicola]|uniref:Uncharacterized protein n=1 Tax=Paraoerskovia sediminicola TaxID=1138587 RepID=A0ABM8G572_9CELL|nr:hypothetical protein [Paraoerskovia sediminicola]BDZ43241.1 hypothetical protein GCM10025865_25400 [Paraoerskovia sediminicola]
MSDAVPRQVPRVTLGAHHDGSELYVPAGTPVLGGTVEVRLRVPSSVDEVWLRSVRDGEPRLSRARPTPGPFGAGAPEPGECWFAADLLVHNPVTSYRFLLKGTSTSPTCG